MYISIEFYLSYAPTAGATGQRLHTACIKYDLYRYVGDVLQDPAIVTLHCNESVESSQLACF